MKRTLTHRLLVLAASGVGRADDPAVDVVVYGATPGGIAAAVAAKPGARGKDIHGQYFEVYPGHAVRPEKPLDAALAVRWGALAGELGLDAGRLPSTEAGATRGAFIRAAWGQSGRVGGTDPAGDVEVVTGMRGLVAFWAFGEEAGRPRLSSGTGGKYPLAEVGGPIPRVAGGPFSGYAAELDGRHYFSIPYAETGGLNISGPEAEVSMYAVVRIVNLKQSRTIAGMWSEGKGADDDSGTRQYALLMNMPTYGGSNKLVPHISSEGGVTRRADGSAFPWCADYASSAGEVPTEEWCTLGFTYDGGYIRAYINGVLDAQPLDPVRHKRTDRYFTGEGPEGKDRGMNPYYHGRGIFRYDPAKHGATKPGGGSDFTVGARYAVGKMLGEATIGKFGGLAVFDRALSDEEMKALHDAANLGALK